MAGTNTILGLFTYPGKLRGLNQLRYKDSTTDAEAKTLHLQLDMATSSQSLYNQKNVFTQNCLKNVFGFAVDYGKIVYGLNWQVNDQAKLVLSYTILVRSSCGPFQ